MLRIILIGNGFDLAHGLKTRYKDFIDDFWEKEKQKVIIGIQNNSIYRPFYYENEYIRIEAHGTVPHLLRNVSMFGGYTWFQSLHDSGIKSLPEYESEKTIIKYKNTFLKKISEMNSLENWVDIENEYYDELKQYYKDLNSIKSIHDDFQKIQGLLINYLTEQLNEKPPTIQKISQYFYSPFIDNDFIKPIKQDEKLEKIIFLNFNYTTTMYLYNYGNEVPNELIHIHGELNKNDNPIIFGYGNEREENYKLIVNKNRNELFKYIKSFRYSKNENYRNLIRNINAREYQIFIFGHSCGLSDGTLLSTLFEHPNCKSIKIFYYENPNGKNNYEDTYMNISRHFSNPEKMREIVVPEKSSLAYC